MEPHKPSNDESWRTYRSGRPTEWISISATNDLKLGTPELTPSRLARSVQQEMDRIVRWPLKRLKPDGTEILLDIRYELRGLDATLGLQVAKTVGRDADKPKTGNNRLYWQGDLRGLVTTAIRCGTGVLPRAGHVHTCDHTFYVREMGAVVSVYYTEDLLPQWKQIEERVRQFILALRVDAVSEPRR